MKVMREARWDKHFDCDGCGSWLRIDQGDLRMTKDGTVHVVCEVCDTKTQMEDVPDYLIVKLKKLLVQKNNPPVV
tara:strand:+ start:4188 stop:4412 length:225 start_codon:yes stop_codon:yes gene_type:complete